MAFTLVPSGRANNYTGPLTRSIVFSGALFLFLATTGLTIAAILTPSWLSYDSQHSKHSHIHASLGLSSRCSNTSRPPLGLTIDPLAHDPTHLTCHPYPRYSDCQGSNRYFCSMWRTTGFLMSFAVVLEGMTIAAFLVLLIGGKQKREQGWSFMATLAALSAVVQAVAMAIVTYLKDNDEKFAVPGWYLDKSWEMCTSSWLIQVFVALSITLAALYLPSEGGYELIPNRAIFDEEDEPWQRSRVE